MDASTNESKKVIHNLNVLRGQIDGVVRMIEEGVIVLMFRRGNSMMGLCASQIRFAPTACTHMCV